MSPTVLKIKGYRFFFFSNDSNEPPHVHIEFGGRYAKFWLNPILLSKSRDFNSSELTNLRKLIEHNRKFLLEKWDEYFDGNKR
jgi:hypothetical protein